MMPIDNFRISRINHSDSTRIQQAANLYKSVGKLFLGQVPNLRGHARENILFGAISGDGELRGVLLAGVVDSQTRKDFEGYVPSSFIKPRTVEILDMAVVPEHRRQGIGMALISEALELYRGYGFDRFLTASRFSLNNGGSSFGLLLRLGFRVLAEIPGYYADCEWLRCPDCGDGRCLCKGFLMLLG